MLLILVLCAVLYWTEMLVDQLGMNDDLAGLELNGDLAEAISSQSVPHQVTPMTWSFGEDSWTAAHEAL